MVVLALVLISGGLIEHPDLLSMVNGGRGVLRDLVGNTATLWENSLVSGVHRAPSYLVTAPVIYTRVSTVRICQPSS